MLQYNYTYLLAYVYSPAQINCVEGWGMRGRGRGCFLGTELQCVCIVVLSGCMHYPNVSINTYSYVLVNE